MNESCVKAGVECGREDFQHRVEKRVDRAGVDESRLNCADMNLRNVTNAFRQALLYTAKIYPNGQMVSLYYTLHYFTGLHGYHQF